jgi:lysophospholipase L1-like esterase
LLGGRGPVVVSVLGDSTGNEDGEWVDLWARGLGATHRVDLHQWDDTRGGWQPRVRAYGQGGPAVTIWNGSKSRAQAAYARTRLDAMQPERPDLVLYSFGHNHSPGRAVGPVRSLVSAVDDRWPGSPSAVLVLPNPQLGATAGKQARVKAELTRWAAKDGLPKIDVYAAFEANADEATLFKDFRHPSPAGSAVWADVVSQALTPTEASR